MNILDKYKQLPSPLRLQLRKIAHIFSNDKEVNHQYAKLLTDVPNDQRDSSSIRRKIFRMSIFLNIKPRFILKPTFVNLIICYSEDGPIIPITKILKSNHHSCLIEGKMSDLPVVIKWYQSSRRDCIYEINIYRRLYDMSCDLPWFSDKFKFWECPVIVMEKLYPLTQHDDEYKIGISVLRQLQKLHTFSIHCDIKPLNIMKKINGTSTTYLLIDYGGATTERLGHGYRRWLWSPKWTSQESHKKNQIVTAKNDFMELGFTMRAMQNWREHNNNKNDGDFHSGYQGRLKKYMTYVKNIDSHNILERDYEQLINILSTRG